MAGGIGPPRSTNTMCPNPTLPDRAVPYPTLPYLATPYPAVPHPKELQALRLEPPPLWPPIAKSNLRPGNSKPAVNCTDVHNRIFVVDRNNR